MDASNNIAISCRGITKNYDTETISVRALRGVDLDVRYGELFMIVGPSGCGKTTLISVIAGILNQDEGDCVVFGARFNQMPERERTILRGQTVGFVFQSYNLIPTLNALENVSIPLLINGKDKIFAEEQAKEMLALVGLGDRTLSFPRELSGGQQQRVAIARSLVHNPKLIVCDEPTASLDHHTGEKVLELFREMARKSGRALVIVTHDSRIFSYADRIAKMDDGRIVEVIKPGDKPGVSLQ